MLPLFFKNYSFAEAIYLVIRYSKRLNTFWETKRRLIKIVYLGKAHIQKRAGKYENVQKKRRYEIDFFLTAVLSV